MDVTNLKGYQVDVFFPPYASKVSDSVAAVSLSFQVDFSYEAGAENILSFKAMLKG
jgi:hypothetical protein